LLNVSTPQIDLSSSRTFRSRTRDLVRCSSRALTVDDKAVSVGLSAQDIDAGPFLNFNLQRKQVLGHLGYKSQDIALLAEMLSYYRLDLTESISSR